MKILENSNSSKNTGGIGRFYMNYRKYRRSCQACLLFMKKMNIRERKLIKYRHVNSATFAGHKIWTFLPFFLPLMPSKVSKFVKTVLDSTCGIKGTTRGPNG